MRVKLFACLVLALTLGGVIANTVIIKKHVNEISTAVALLDEESDEALPRAKGIQTDFKRRLTYISLTVSHDDLTNIESEFAELIGYLEVGDTDGAHVTKNRLIDSLEHLGRLSGFNIDAII